MQNKFFKKGLVVGIIVILIGVSVASSTSRINLTILKTTGNDGSLLGYVNDLSGNPIEGALIRVHFHGTYEENYSDEDGYYHVFNIPICYCMKNATCSKEGYKTEWELLSIAENTTHDFVLTSGNNPPEAPLIKGKRHPDKPGEPYNYTFKAIDPDDDDVRYFIDWNDDSSEWTDYYPSGMEIIVAHTWPDMGTADVMARANDTHGALGPWGYIQWSKDEDCFKCQSNGKTHLAEKLLTRLDNNEVLSNVINLKNSDNRPICILLNKLWNDLSALYTSLIELAKTFPEGSIRRDILEETAYIILVYFYARVKSIWAFTFNCSE